MAMPTLTAFKGMLRKIDSLWQFQAVEKKARISGLLNELRGSLEDPLN